MPIEAVWEGLRADHKSPTEAAKELGRRFGEKDAIAFFVGWWRQNDQWQPEALEALAALGGQVSLIESVMQREDVEGLATIFGHRLLRDGAVEAVKRLGAEARVTAWLIAWLPDDPYNQVIHQGAIWAVGEFRDRHAVEALLRILTDERLSRTPRELAAEALGKIGESLGIPLQALVEKCLRGDSDAARELGRRLASERP